MNERHVAELLRAVEGGRPCAASGFWLNRSFGTGLVPTEWFVVRGLEDGRLQVCPLLIVSDSPEQVTEAEWADLPKCGEESKPTT